MLFTFKPIATLFPILLTAAFEARYAYDPPELLSAMLPTREDMRPTRRCKEREEEEEREAALEPGGVGRKGW